MVSGVCAAQQSSQFNALPYVQSTYGRVTSILSGTFQYQSNAPGPDILYINAPTTDSAGDPAIVAGILANYPPTFQFVGADVISFTKVSNVVAASADFDNDGKADFAFALSPPPNAAPGRNYICVYYGTGANSNNNNFSNNGVSSYNAGSIANAYPPTGGKSGCKTFATLGNLTPNFAYIAALPFATGGVPQLLVEDSANNYLYVFSNDKSTGNALPGFQLIHSYPIPLADGAGPIYTGSFDNKTGNFDGNGHAFFVINGQKSHTATVYTGDGTGVFTAQQPLSFNKGVYSMLLQDMSGDGIPDMVVEGANGGIAIYKGDGNGNFTTNIGGTAPGANALTGKGGHLAAISNIDGNGLIEILTATPIGLSVLENSGSYSQNYSLKNIYDIGPGHSSFALAPFYGGNYPLLAVDSAEGVALIQGNADGSFNTSLAYSALAPALGATVGPFRPLGSNPTNNVDVVVATATNAVQGQLLIGNGNGTFNALPGTTNPLASLMANPPPANLWSNILYGDFNGDGKLDLAYSLTGTPGSYSGPGLYVQYGVGDGTFQPPVAVTPSGASGSNTLFGESAVGLFDKSGNSGIANIDANYDDTLLWQSPNTFNLGLNQAKSNTNFNQVAAGYIKTGSSYQDLVFQQGAATLVPYKIKQDGSGMFTAGNPLTVPSPVGNYAISTVLLTDIDGDGNGDILALYHNLASIPSDPSDTTPNYLYIWWGDGTGNFSKTPFTLSLTRNYYLAAVADMNGDTLPDIALSDGYLVSILYNQGGLGSPVNRSFGSEAHFLAGQGINSLTLQNVSGGKVPDLVVANGGATISNPIVLGGVAQTSATLTANPPDTNTGGITVLLNNITALQTTGTLAALPEPSIIGDPFTITATLTPSSGNTPAGPVTFYIDNTTTPVCTVPLAAIPGTTSSTAQCPVPAVNIYGAGSNTLTAVYLGDPNNAQTTLIGTHLIIANTTTTVLSMCIASSLTPNCPLNGPPSGLTPVTPLPPMIYGQEWDGTVVVTPSGTTLDPTSTTTIFDALNGSSPASICTIPVAPGSICPLNVGIGEVVGTHQFTATYNGDATHSGSTSLPPIVLNVSPDTPTATVTSSLPTAPSGQSVTLTATLTGLYAPTTGAGTPPTCYYVPPTGTVIFMNGNMQIGTGALAPTSTCVSSTATFATTTLPVGTDQITVTYAGDTNFKPATSAPFIETITPLVAPSFTITATPNPVNAGVGYAALLTVTVAANNGFAEEVNLSCGNLPNEATCTFAPAAIASGGGASQLIMETTAPHTCGTTQPYFLGGNGGGPHLAPFALPALAGLVAFLIPGKRRWLRSLMALIAVAAITQMTGCSTCTDLGTKPATYTFQVIGTSAVTGEVQSQTVTLNVTI
jgi:hypothetical protein